MPLNATCDFCGRFGQIGKIVNDISRPEDIAPRDYILLRGSEGVCSCGTCGVPALAAISGGNGAGGGRTIRTWAAGGRYFHQPKDSHP